jgi:sulfopyruvate decarboxylase TPP-binding subunit
MTDASTVALSPETVLRHMTQNGVTDVVWLPDSETNWLFLLMQAEPSLRLIGVTREGHACSIAAGLHAGGRKPLILIQNTGMMESGDSIRGWLLGMNVPVVLMVGYRGWTRHGVTALNMTGGRFRATMAGANPTSASTTRINGTSVLVKLASVTRARISREAGPKIATPPYCSLTLRISIPSRPACSANQRMCQVCR